MPTTAYSLVALLILPVATALRYCARVKYDGTCFHGVQKNTRPDDGTELRTILSTLEASLIPALDQTVKFCVAGRTDAGVSALGDRLAGQGDPDVAALRPWRISSSVLLHASAWCDLHGQSASARNDHTSRCHHEETSYAGHQQAGLGHGGGQVRRPQLREARRRQSVAGGRVRDRGRAAVEQRHGLAHLEGGVAELREVVGVPQRALRVDRVKARVVLVLREQFEEECHR